MTSGCEQVYVGWSFHVGAFKALKRGRANMDVLISGGSIASYVYSLISVFHRYSQYKRGNQADAKDYFETAALLITFLSLGKLLEAIAKGKTSEVCHLQRLESTMKDVMNTCSPHIVASY